MSAPAEIPITVQEKEHVLLIGLNRPDKYNAMNLAAIDQLAQAYQLLEDSPHLRVGVVHAHGDHFSAGLDLAEVGPEVARRGPGALGGNTDVDPYGLWAGKVSKPIVVALHGISFTLSIELALASDIVVAAENVRFRQLEVGRGIMPFGGATVRAAQQLGWGNAMRFLLTGEEFGAEEALRIGLIQEITPVGQDTQRAIEIAEMIAKQAPLGVYATLANARISREEGELAAIEHLRETLPGILASQDAAEGIQSFLERRDGNFTGT
jgi:enoyl-CoA hydratase/carnithine racemase